MSGFGPAVIGEKAFAEEQKRQKGLRGVFGPAVVDGATAEVADEAAIEEVAVESLSVRDVKDIMSGDVAPAVIDRVMQAEVGRPDGPRKSALVRILAAEQRRESPRPEVTEVLEELLAEA